MEWLNYHHLLYFWVVAREGGLLPAGRVLRLSHPTLSMQIHKLEDQLGEKLFTKVGRKLVLTEMGHVVYRYADDIFALGRELTQTVAGKGEPRALKLVVGIVDAVPKLVARRLLKPALALPEKIKLVCFEDNYERLLADLSTHSLDVVISDAPVPAGSAVRAYHHLLGESGVSVFGTAKLAKTFGPEFPKSLHKAPMLLPLDTLSLRRGLNQWFDSHDVHPTIVAEFEDSALLKAFGAEGHGLFVAPTVIEAEVSEQFGVRSLGRLPGITERFYAISTERRVKHPAVTAIRDDARQWIVK